VRRPTYDDGRECQSGLHGERQSLTDFKLWQAGSWTVSFAERLRYWYLAWFSRPVGERLLYRAIRRQRAGAILEIGVGDAARAARLIQVAGLGRPRAEVRYVAIDPFDLRGEEQGAPLSLKEAHCRLRPTGAQTRLLPGDVYSVLARMANGLGKFDIVVIAACHNDDALARAWFYLPRVVNDQTQFWIEQPADKGGTAYQPLDRAQVAAFTQPAARRKAA
jgi:hypothetical protein